MMTKANDLTGWARRNWFVPLLAFLLAIEWAFARTDWPRDGLAEAVILFDLCLFVPALHFLCYRRTVAWKPLLIRTFALASLGVYLASHLIPADAQHFLAGLGWARLAGFVVLAALELWVLVKVIKLVFGATATVEEISATSGAPPWIARLMLIEARFWKWLWRLFRRSR
jgi:hypothetical protein